MQVSATEDEKMDQMPKIKVQTDCKCLDVKPHQDHLYAAYIQKLTFKLHLGVAWSEFARMTSPNN